MQKSTWKVHLLKELISRKTNNMLSITKCKRILNRNGIHYTDEEIIILRDALYKLAQIMLADYKEKQNKN